MNFDLKKELARKENKEKVLENMKDKLEKEKTMALSVKEGSATSAMTGLTSSYLSLYALQLKANNAQIGFLSSFPGLISPISQILSLRLMEKYSRKKIIIFFVFLQALMWLPILLLSFFSWKNIFAAYLPIVLIVFYTLYAIFGAVAGPAWFSLMGDIVPEKIRGKYFGKRSRICEIVVIIFAFLAAFILDFFKTKGFLLLGFSILFFLATIFRLISSFLFKKHYEPKFKLKKDYYFTIFQFIRKAPYNNFGIFVIYVALIYLASSIAGPFFSVYMKKDLNFSYTTIMLINISASISSLLLMPILGKFADRYGNRKLLKIGSILIPLVPVLWLFSSSPVFLALIPQFLGGIGWAAFSLAVTNFIYDSVSVQRRALCVSYLNVLVGVGVFLGASLGGILAQYLILPFNILLFIFLLSGILRFLIFILMFPKIKEVRKTAGITSPLLILKKLNPTHELTHNIIDGMSKIEKEIKKSRERF